MKVIVNDFENESIDRRLIIAPVSDMPHRVEIIRKHPGGVIFNVSNYDGQSINAFWFSTPDSINQYADAMMHVANLLKDIARGKYDY